MSELKPCPFCGYHAVLEPMTVRKGYEAVVHCNGCLASVNTITYDTEEEATQEAITAWNNRAEQPNEPLTLEQLKHMEGEPVCIRFYNRAFEWCRYFEEYVDEGVEYIKFDIFGTDIKYAVKKNDYGKTWLAYRTKPQHTPKWKDKTLNNFLGRG